MSSKCVLDFHHEQGRSGCLVGEHALFTLAGITTTYAEPDVNVPHTALECIDAGSDLLQRVVIDGGGNLLK